MGLFSRAFFALPLTAALFATPAAAGVTLLNHVSGTGTNMNWVAKPGDFGGSYRVELTSSQPIYFEYEVSYLSHWDIFFAPAPRPHSEFLVGNHDPSYAGNGAGTMSALAFNFVIPEMTRTYFTSTGYGPDPSLPTLLYREVKPEQVQVYVRSFNLGGPEFKWDLKFYSVSAVPEPQIWALMITGFGLAGAALRRSRRQVLAA